MNRRAVALLSDFGTRDVYAGVMKAVIEGISPGTDLIDLTHEISPGDVRSAAFRLWQAAPYLPEGTVVLAVVDPGVGTSRRAVAMEFDSLLCVGPDNGIFTYLLATRPCRTLVEITRVPGSGPASGVSQTFHGRDVFAPAAGLLCNGTPLLRLGPPAADPLRFRLPRLAVSASRVSGEVIAIDGFGNGITSIGALQRGDNALLLDPWLPGLSPVRLEGTAFKASLGSAEGITLAGTFGEVPAGDPLAYIGSSRLLEVGVNGGRAADRLSFSVGTSVELKAVSGRGSR